MSKIGKGERNRAGLHAEIAEPHPIFCKDTDKRGQSGPIRILPNESILGFVQDANEPNAKANKFVFCRNKISTTKLRINGKSRLVNLVLLPLWYGNKDIIRDNISKCHR